MERLRLWLVGGILLGTCLLGCERDKRGTAEKTVGEWIGREIVFSDDAYCLHLGKDTACPSHHDVPYTVLLYILVDRDNRALAIGNPTLNPKLWNLYKAIITGESHKPAIGKSNARAP